MSGLNSQPNVKVVSLSVTKTTSFWVDIACALITLQHNALPTRPHRNYRSTQTSSKHLTSNRRLENATMWDSLRLAPTIRDVIIPQVGMNLGKTDHKKQFWSASKVYIVSHVNSLMLQIAHSAIF